MGCFTCIGTTQSVYKIFKNYLQIVTNKQQHKQRTVIRVEL